MFGVVHNYADELSSGDHGVHLCSVLYTIMPMNNTVNTAITGLSTTYTFYGIQVVCCIYALYQHL